MWGNARRTVKRNSKKRDKDAHSGTKWDREKPNTKPTKTSLECVDGCKKLQRRDEESQLTMARKMSSSVQTELRTITVMSERVNFG